MPILPQQQTIVQYQASASQTVYTFAFYAPLPTDIQVFLQAPNAIPIPSADILVLNVDYTVTYNNDPFTGGFITLTVAPTSGWYLTINRMVAASITTNFSAAQNINGADLDAAFDRVVLLCQQNLNYNLQRNLSYIINTYLPNASPYTQLPPLPINNVWVGTANGVVAALLAVSPSASVLQSMLANNGNGTDGALLVGYYNPYTNTPTTVDAALNTLNGAVDNSINANMMIGGDFGTNPWQRGVSFTNPAQGVYTADRFTVLNTGTSAVLNVLQVADAPTALQAGVYSSNCIAYQVTTAAAVVNAGDVYGTWYKFEGLDISLLGMGQPGVRQMTLSFWHKHTVPGIYSGSFTNASQNRCYVFEYTQTTAATWEKAVITLPVDVAGTWLYTNGIGMYLFLCQAVGSNYQAVAGAWGTGGAFGSPNQVNNLATIGNLGKFDLFKLEVGGVATQFPQEPAEIVLAKCQRYFEKTYNLGVYAGATTAVGNVNFALSGVAASGNNMSMSYKVTKRATPNSATVYSYTLGTINAVSQIDGSDVAATTSNIGQSGFTVNWTNGTGKYGGAFHWIVDAEL